MPEAKIIPLVRPLRNSTLPSAKGVWLKTNIYRDGPYLQATTYVVTAGEPEVFSLKIDLRPIIAAVAKYHKMLHHDQIQGCVMGDCETVMGAIDDGLTELVVGAKKRAKAKAKVSAKVSLKAKGKAKAKAPAKAKAKPKAKPKAEKKKKSGGLFGFMKKVVTAPAKAAFKISKASAKIALTPVKGAIKTVTNPAKAFRDFKKNPMKAMAGIALSPIKSTVKMAKDTGKLAFKTVKGQARYALQTAKGSVLQPVKAIAKGAKAIGRAKLLKAVGKTAANIIRSKATKGVVGALAVAMPAVGVPALAALTAANAGLNALERGKEVRNNARNALSALTAAKKVAAMGLKSPAAQRLLKEGKQVASALTESSDAAKGGLLVAAKQAANVRKSLKTIANRAKAGDESAKKSAAVLAAAARHRDRLDKLAGKSGDAVTGLVVNSEGKILTGQFAQKVATEGAGLALLLAPDGRVTRGYWDKVEGIIGCV